MILLQPNDSPSTLNPSADGNYVILIVNEACTN